MAKTKPEELTIEEALQIIEDQKQSIKQLEADLKEKDALISEIRSAGKTAAVQNPTFEYQGKTYEVKIPKFRYGTEVYTAADLCEQIEIQKDLIENGSEIIAEVTE